MSGGRSLSYRYRLECLSANKRSTHKSYFVDLLLLMGFQVYYAKGEAERACAALCIADYVDAVLSNDSDHIAMGCSELITPLW